MKKYLLFLLMLSVLSVSEAKSVLMEGTSTTPTISFDLSNGILTIKGKSNPESAINFYRQLHELVDSYQIRPESYTIINIRLKDIDDDSLDELKLILSKFESNGKPLLTVVNWFYEENDKHMMRIISNIQEESKLHFKVISEDFFRWNVLLDMKEKNSTD